MTKTAFSRRAGHSAAHCALMHAHPRLQDLPGALSSADVAMAMGLADVNKTREWAIFPSSAKKGEGIKEGMEWLANKLAGRQ